MKFFGCNKCRRKSVGHLALFAGGQYINNPPVATVDVYDSLTGLWSTTQLSVPRTSMAATAVGSMAMFAGGVQLEGTSGFASNVVDIYTATSISCVSQHSLLMLLISHSFYYLLPILGFNKKMLAKEHPINFMN